MDHKPCKINSLCIRENTTIRVVCFKAAAPLLSFASKFSIMIKNSGLFDATWKTFMKQARANNQAISIGEIESQVWTPAFDHCNKILEELRGLSMTLSSVDNHFENYLTESELVSELKILFHGVHQCIAENSSPNHHWIKDRVIQIVNYRKLCEYCDAGNSFLKLKESLKLTKGDFRDVERISQEV